MFEADSLREALNTLGTLLLDRGLAFEIVGVVTHIKAGRASG